jgi:ABC-type Zn2+ transport system substrate-binding protein/surface adhesin
MNTWIVTLGALTLTFVLWELSLWGLNPHLVAANQKSGIAPLESEARPGHKHSNSEVGHQEDHPYKDDHTGHDHSGREDLHKHDESRNDDHSGRSHESERENDLKETN